VDSQGSRQADHRYLKLTLTRESKMQQLNQKQVQHVAGAGILKALIGA
jgi:hypothetical protein